METVLTSLVNSLAKEAEQTMQSEREAAKFRQLLPALLNRGIDNIDFSMFGPEMRYSILDLMGDEFIRRGNLAEAQKAFVLSSNQPRLSIVADDKGC